MKFSPNLEWIVPYVELGLQFIPNKKVTRLGEWKLGQRYGKGVHAAIFTSDDKNYRIYLHTMYHPRSEKSPKPFSSIDLIKTLAHEMAHMSEFEHTPAHTKLEAKIVSAFMNKLSKEGYVSEEAELENLP